MTNAACLLPENPAELRAFAEALQNRNQMLEDELYAKTLHIEKLKMQLTTLRRKAAQDQIIYVPFTECGSIRKVSVRPNCVPGRTLTVYFGSS
jgi:hypothetical protein